MGSLQCVGHCPKYLGVHCIYPDPQYECGEKSFPLPRELSRPVLLVQLPLLFLLAPSSHLVQWETTVNMWDWITLSPLCPHPSLFQNLPTFWGGRKSGEERFSNVWGKQKGWPKCFKKRAFSFSIKVQTECRIRQTAWNRKHHNIYTLFCLL